MCTLDDIVDWEEDLERGRFTYPLQEATTNASRRLQVPKSDLTRAAVFRSLACSDIYHTLMKEITDQLDLAEKEASGLPRLAFWLLMVKNDCLTSWKSHVRYLLTLAHSEDVSATC